MTLIVSNLYWKQTKVVILTNKRIQILDSILIGVSIIKLKPTLTYLGMMFGPKVHFFEQIKAPADKAAAGVLTLIRLMVVLRLVGVTSTVTCYITCCTFNPRRNHNRHDLF